MEHMNNNHRLIEHRCYQVLTQLSSLPYRMVTTYDRERLSEFVLHTLCHADCFDIKKAAYFINNPDFNCFKGVAGFEEQYACALETIRSPRHWDHPEEFCDHMCNSVFNKQVRSVALPSIQGNGDEMQLLHELAAQLGLERPAVYKFGLKHNNSGMVLVEHNEELSNEVKGYIEHGMSFLAFCPIF